jgi:dipicolinate synthase subunit B
MNTINNSLKQSSLSGVKVAFALTGSFCTFETTIEQMKVISDLGAQIIPIMSANAYSTDTRFGKAVDFRKQIVEICSNEIIHTISGAEPIGPKKMADVMVVAPWWAGF